MSRVVKFRAFDPKNGMIEPYSVRNGKAWVIKPCRNDSPEVRVDGVNYYCNWDIDIPTDFPLMQFTGLLDVNGVEVYEADVIKGLLVDKRGERFEFIGSVFYQEYEFCVETDLHSWPVAAWHCVEKPVVIGNIYQHPEPLK
jgi:uncharacterized phage protein (TIGR01671 family)